MKLDFEIAVDQESRVKDRPQVPLGAHRVDMPIFGPKISNFLNMHKSKLVGALLTDLLIDPGLISIWMSFYLKFAKNGYVIAQNTMPRRGRGCQI